MQIILSLKKIPLPRYRPSSMVSVASKKYKRTKIFVWATARKVAGCELKRESNEKLYLIILANNFLRGSAKTCVLINLKSGNGLLQLMIYGIGVDIVKVSRIRDAMERRGERFVNRLFTDLEKEYCQDRGDAAARYALRFAAKEAFSKALGVGLRRGIHCKQIEVVNDPSGKPSLRLYGKAKSVCEEIGIRNSFLSLSDDGGYAVAMVVLEV